MARVKNAQPDVPDLRDYIYRPTLEQLEPRLNPGVSRAEILDQGNEGACTGFTMAAVITECID